MKATREQVEAFRPGVYRHWKGALYRALFLGQDSTNRDGKESTEEPTVAYVALSDGTGHQGNICFRELWQWMEPVMISVKGTESMLNGPRVSVPRFLWRSP